MRTAVQDLGCTRVEAWLAGWGGWLAAERVPPWLLWCRNPEEAVERVLQVLALEVEQIMKVGREGGRACGGGGCVLPAWCRCSTVAPHNAIAQHGAPDQHPTRPCPAPHPPLPELHASPPPPPAQGKFDHYMAKEIHEQPDALMQTMTGGWGPGPGRVLGGGACALGDAISRTPPACSHSLCKPAWQQL